MCPRHLGATFEKDVFLVSQLYRKLCLCKVIGAKKGVGIKVVELVSTEDSRGSVKQHCQRTQPSVKRATPVRRQPAVSRMSSGPSLQRGKQQLNIWQE